MDEFEKIIKKSVDSYEAPYSEAAWKALEGKLGRAKGGFTNWLIGSAIAAAVIAFGTWYLLPTEAPSSQLATVEKTNKLVNLPPDSKTENKLGTESTENSEVVSEVKQELTVNSERFAVEKEEGDVSTDLAKENLISQIHSDEKVDYSQNISSGNKLDAITPQVEQELQNLIVEEEQIDFSKFNLQVVADKVNVCVGEAISLSPSIPKLKADYQWVIDGNKTINGAYSVQEFSTPGNHTVALNLINRKTGKVANQSENISITVNALPSNEISYEYDNALSPSVIFSQKNMFYKSINWDLKGLHQTNEKSFSYNFRNKGNYVISCQLVGENGCQSESSTTVSIESNYNLLAPSAFTPNGDNLNETFIPKALLISTNPFIMTIYDKSGKLVYETNDARRPWDGLHTRDLSPAPSGSYVWIVQLTNDQNQVETYQGQVTITR